LKGFFGGYLVEKVCGGFGVFMGEKKCLICLLLERERRMREDENRKQRERSRTMTPNLN
jgi:hypothetical protein